MGCIHSHSAPTARPTRADVLASAADENDADGVLVLDAQLRICYASKTSCSFHGAASDASLIGRALVDVVSEGHEFATALSQAVHTYAPIVRGQYHLPHKHDAVLYATGRPSFRDGALRSVIVFESLADPDRAAALQPGIAARIVHAAPTAVPGDAERIVASPANPAAAASTAADDRLMTYAVHELFNALHALDASASAIADSASALPPNVASDIVQDLSDIVLASVNTHVLVNDILSLTKLREGALLPVPEPVAVRLMLKDVVARLRATNPVAVAISVAPNVPRSVVIDSTHLSQVLLNALVNSVRHNADASTAGSKDTTKPPSIAVIVSRVGERKLRFEVADAGGGLGGYTSEQLMSALSEGRQIKGARAQRISLILPIARNLLELMNGSVSVSEPIPGVTSFAVTVPYSDPSTAEVQRLLETQADALATEQQGVLQTLPPGPLSRASVAAGFPREGVTSVESASPGTLRSTVTTAASSSALVPATSGAVLDDIDSESVPRKSGEKRRPVKVVGLDGVPLNMHVLLVDDVRVIRRQGELFLEQLGCTCVTLEDGDEVRDLLTRHPRPFDAIVMDILMHRSDGAQVCRELREVHKVRCPIIAMTSLVSSSELQRYYAMGFDVVLPKPFTREAIGRALVEGRERRGGNTRFARMAARIDRRGPAESDALNGSRAGAPVESSGLHSGAEIVPSSSAEPSLSQVPAELHMGSDTFSPVGPTEGKSSGSSGALVVTGRDPSGTRHTPWAERPAQGSSASRIPSGRYRPTPLDGLPVSGPAAPGVAPLHPHMSSHDDGSVVSGQNVQVALVPSATAAVALGGSSADLGARDVTEATRSTAPDAGGAAAGSDESPVAQAAPPADSLPGYTGAAPGSSRL